MRVFSLLLAYVSFILLAATSQASITMNPSNIYANAYDPNVGYTQVAFDSQAYNGSSIPTNTTLNVTVGSSHSNNNINWNVISGQTVLSLGMDHQRTGDYQYAYAQTYESMVRFTANSNDPYEASGFYNVTDVGTGGGRDYFYTYVYDLTAGTYLFFNYQESRYTHNEQFTLGGTGGDVSNTSFGSVTGNLINGHQYQMYTDIFIQAYPDSDQGASALGNVTLKIGTANGTVPEPLSVLVWGGLACAALTVSYRRTFA